MESLSWPPHKSPLVGHSEKFIPQGIFEITLIENKLDAHTDSKRLIDDNVFAEGFGEILLVIQSHTPQPGLEGHKLLVEFSDIEIINLDTISQYNI